jgi:hypothetical protein
MTFPGGRLSRLRPIIFARHIRSQPQQHGGSDGYSSGGGPERAFPKSHLGVNAPPFGMATPRQVISLPLLRIPL